MRDGDILLEKPGLEHGIMGGSMTDWYWRSCLRLDQSVLFSLSPGDREGAGEAAGDGGPSPGSDRSGTEHFLLVSICVLEEGKGWAGQEVARQSLGFWWVTGQTQ